MNAEFRDLGSQHPTFKKEVEGRTGQIDLDEENYHRGDANIPLNRELIFGSGAEADLILRDRKGIASKHALFTPNEDGTVKITILDDVKTRTTKTWIGKIVLRIKEITNRSEILEIGEVVSFNRPIIAGRPVRFLIDKDGEDLLLVPFTKMNTTLKTNNTRFRRKILAAKKKETK